MRTKPSRKLIAITLFGLPALASAALFGPLRFWDGPQAYSHFGDALANAGDVDGDGVLDHVIGAPGEPGTSASRGEARAYSGANGQLLWGWQAAQTNMKLGFAVAGAGDLDQDGHADVIVGGPTSLENHTSQVMVFSGGTGLPLYTWASGGVTWTTGDMTWGTGDGAFGAAVSGGGDINGDGFPDVLTGAPRAAGPSGQKGIVRAFSGRNGQPIRNWRGENGAWEFGASLASHHDLNADGRADVVVGAPAPKGTSGSDKVYAYSGSTGAFLWSRIVGTSSTALGAVPLDTIGDLNGDGIPDVLVGRSQYGANQVMVLSGKDGEPIQSILYPDGPANSGARFGAALSAMPDVDADGYPDVLVGAPGAGLDSQGKVYLCSGKSGKVIRSWAGTSAQDRFGSRVSTAGTVNGVPRFLVGAYPAGTPTLQGRVYLFSCGISSITPVDVEKAKVEIGTLK